MRTATVSTGGGFDGPFLEAAEVAARLLRSPTVGAAWEHDSVLPQMTVGALACHLADQLHYTATLLPATPQPATPQPATPQPATPQPATPQPATPQPAIAVVLSSADEHYARAAWVTAESLEHPANDRSNKNAAAARGCAAMRERLERDLELNGQLLRSGEAAPIVTIPWQGWALPRGDFVLTRLVELTVHTCDLAVSIDVPAPQFPPAAFDPVVGLLARLAARRHGQHAVIGTLTRRERTRTISAF